MEAPVETVNKSTEVTGSVFGEIEQTPCPKCKLPFLVKKAKKDGSTYLFCNDKTCGYKAE